MKTQGIRLIDVFAFGPAMIVISAKQPPGWQKQFLFWGGVLTVVYNAGNYLKGAK